MPHIEGHGPASAEEIEAYSRRSVASIPAKTAIHNVRVFTGSCMSAPRTITFDEQGYFIDADDTVPGSTPAARNIDGAGQFLIPGLMDAHAHVQSMEGLANMTAYGVTTVFNMNCANYTSCAALQAHGGTGGLARFQTAGQAAVSAGGRLARVLGLPPSAQLGPGANLSQAVATALDAGADFYKITVEVGGLDLATQQQLVAETHRRGGKTMTHAADPASYALAVASGSDGLQHVPAGGVLAPALIRQMAASGHQYVTPTLELYRLSEADPALRAIFFGNNTAASYAHALENVRNMRTAGIPVIAGTDAVGVTPLFTIPYGVTLHGELANLVEAGYTPAQALRAATSLTAARHGLGDRGAVRAGLRADCVLLRSNPLETIANTRDISRVWVGGVEYPGSVAGSQ